MAKMTSDPRNPEQQAYDHELRSVLERAIDSLPEIYRLVFTLRSIEGLSVGETAGCLDIGEEARQDQTSSGEIPFAKRPAATSEYRYSPSLSISPIAVRSPGGSGLSQDRAWGVKRSA